jgi:hypothetical protein
MAARAHREVADAMNVDNYALAVERACGVDRYLKRAARTHSVVSELSDWKKTVHSLDGRENLLARVSERSVLSPIQVSSFA